MNQDSKTWLDQVVNVHIYRDKKRLCVGFTNTVPLLDREYRLGSIAAPKHRVLAETDDAGVRTVTMAARIDGPTGSVAIDGAGTGPIDAFVNGFNAVTGQSIRTPATVTGRW